MNIPEKYAMVDIRKIQEIWNHYQLMPIGTSWEKFLQEKLGF